MAENFLVYLFIFPGEYVAMQYTLICTSPVHGMFFNRNVLLESQNFTENMKQLLIIYSLIHCTLSYTYNTPIYEKQPHMHRKGTKDFHCITHDMFTQYIK